ncbi:MAG: DUF882 domain-containing protein [Deltaproteobacteria bacterium]|nr:DUF882 domain-containing protein [Deltaproteobacteria bacterium]
MLPILLKLRLATSMMAGWSASSSPVPLPTNAIVMLVAGRTVEPIEVKLFDENHRTDATLLIERDGSTDPGTMAQVAHLFRCRVTDREKPIAQRTLAMLADVSERYQGKTIEFVSAYRVQRGESSTSPHRAGRAIDFRIRGVQLRDIRDYLWRKYTSVGIGWYPSEQFIHMDTRPGLNDTAWTFVNGNNRYHPYWSELARTPEPAVQAKPPSRIDRRSGS